MNEATLSPASATWATSCLAYRERPTGKHAIFHFRQKNLITRLPWKRNCGEVGRDPCAVTNTPLQLGAAESERLEAVSTVSNLRRAVETFLNLVRASSTLLKRSEERRVGKECRSRWSP